MFFSLDGDNREHVDIEVRGLLDSGAQVNMIGQNVLKSVSNWGDHITHPNLTITTCDQTAKYRPIGVIDVAFKFNGIVRTTPVVVLPLYTPHPVLGVPFMKAFHIRMIQDVKALTEEEKVVVNMI